MAVKSSVGGMRGSSDRQDARRPHRPAANAVSGVSVIEEREDIIYGRNPILEALKAGRGINRVLMISGQKDGVSNQIRGLARESGFIVEEVSKERLDRLTSGLHQGVVAFTAPKDYVEFDDLLDNITDLQSALIVVLDEVEDPRNLGAILRTCDAAGVNGVVIPKRRAVGLTDIVAKASAGAIEYIPVTREVNLVRALQKLKERGFWVVGVDMDGGQYHYESNLTGPLALVIGGEGKGLGRLLKENCDFVVKLPMLGKVSSLNVSVAASVVLYEIIRQRSKK